MTSIRANGRIEFRFYRPGVNEVALVGSFNNWDKLANPLRHIGEGWWMTDATIEPGDHHFRYIADGHWFTDFAANGVEKNKHGWNSVLTVPERRLRIGMPAREIEVEGQDEALAA